MFHGKQRLGMQMSHSSLVLVVLYPVVMHGSLAYLPDTWLHFSDALIGLSGLLPGRRNGSSGLMGKHSPEVGQYICLLPSASSYSLSAFAPTLPYLEPTLPTEDIREDIKSKRRASKTSSPRQMCDLVRHAHQVNVDANQGLSLFPLPQHHLVRKALWKCLLRTYYW